MREVVDYKDIRKLEESSLNLVLKSGVVITATSELASAMSSYYQEYTVYDIHGFISAIIPEWEENVKDIKNYVMLRNVIEDYLTDNEVNPEASTYLRRNAGDMWNAIKLLIEADVYPDDVDTLRSIPLKHFKNIWKELEVANSQIMAFRSAFAFELSQKENVVKKIEDEVGELKQDVFLFGFYFITPIQDRIFDVLEASGYNLVFVNCHDADYDFATKIWEGAFPQQYADGKIKTIQNEDVLRNYFGEALKGEKNDIPIEIYKHHTEFDFAEMVKGAVDRGEIVYSPNAKRCEKILKEYYPEYYQRKHLLSYPVGQYIYYLHMMWNSFSNHMDLRYEYVYKCFASGWLSDDEFNGRDYLYEMSLLEPFFKRCHSREKWVERLQSLKEAKEAISGFKKRDKGGDRWHSLLGNPFNNVGIYTIDDSSIEIITGLILKLIKDADYLFSNSDRTDLFDHFTRISNIIREHIDKDDLLAEETEIANELLIQLSDESTHGIVCPMNGIRDAIIMLIGDHFEEYESQDEETADQERMVLPLSMVEAAMLNNYGQKVHLVLADEFELPGQPKKLPWPLTDEMLDGLQIDGRDNTVKYVRDMRAVIDNRPLAYRYLFFSFMGISNSENRPVLSLEWICNKDKKEIDISPYVKLLDTEKKMKDVIGLKEDYQKVLTETEVSVKGHSIDPPAAQLPEEVRMDYLLCKSRYVYSYLLNWLPRYTSEFQYSFELSKLISAFSIVSGIDKAVIEKRIGELFPFLRHIELRQSADFATSQGIPEPVEYDGVEYPAQRLLTHFINDDVINKARKRDADYLEDNKIPDKREDGICIYCPYSDVCIDRHREEVLSYE